MVSVLTFVIQRKRGLFGRSLLLTCFLLDLLEFTGDKGKGLSYFNLTAVLALGFLFWLAKILYLNWSLLTEEKRLEMKVKVLVTNPERKQMHHLLFWQKNSLLLSISMWMEILVLLTLEY